MAFLDTLIKSSVFIATLLAVFVQITPDPIEKRQATPNIPAKRAVGTVGYNISLHASAEDVWKDLNDFKSYGSWSTKIPAVTFNDDVIKAGSTGSITADNPGKKPLVVPIVIVSIDHEARRLVWKGIVNIPLWAYDAERVQEVVESAENPGWCEYRTWDTWRGPLAYIMQWAFKKWAEETHEFWMEKEVKPYMERKR